MMTNIYLIIYFLICTILGYFFLKTTQILQKINIIDDKNKTIITSQHQQAVD